MSLKFTLMLAALASSSFVFGACGMGELTSPAGPDSDGDGVPDSLDPNPNLAVPGDSDGSKNLGSRHAELKFTCNQAARAPTELRSLSRPEYQNTLRALLRASTSEATAGAVMQSAASALAAYPEPTVTKVMPFSAMDQAMSQARVESLVRVGSSVGQALTSSPQRMAELVGSCVSQNDAGAVSQCVDSFIDRFGKRALRHPLSQQEHAFYREVYGSGGTSVDAAGIADVVAVMLNAPQFAYRVELGGKPVDGNPSLFQLSDHEIATRLAYQFWQTAPDDELLAAADRGELATDAGFTAALDRVLSDPRAGDGIERFAREWLGLDSLRPLESLVGTPVYDAFAGDDSPTPQLKEEMIQDVTESLAYHAFDKPTSLADWIESPYAFATSPELAAIYKTPVWDGKGEPPRFPQKERAGLITRAALLSTGTANTRPIMKGVMLRERLLCDALPPPPANATKLPDVSLDKTTRELVQGLTEVPGSNCAGCHTTQINPLGFATEGYDALGRVRTEQPLFNDKGNVVAKKPVDTHSVPRVWGNDTTPSSGAADLTSLIVESGKAEACFAREWVRYSTARLEKVEVDGCELETIRATLSAGGTIKDALRKYALLPQFRQRYLPAS